MWIHDHHWRPPPSGPFDAEPAGRSMPLEARRRPGRARSRCARWRRGCRRSPPARASASQARATSAQEVVAGRRLLGHLLVAAAPVDADRARRHEHLRRRGGGQQALDQVARAELARLADGALLGVGPAALHVLRGEVHDRVDARQRLGRRRPLERAPRVHPLHVRLRVGGAGEGDDGVPVRGQGFNEGAADEPGRAGDEDPHVPSFRTPMRRRTARRPPTGPSARSRSPAARCRGRRPARCRGPRRS